MKFKLNLRQVRLIIVGLSLVLLAGGGGYRLGSHGVGVDFSKQLPFIVNRQKPFNREGVDFSLFWQVWDIVETHYLDKEAIVADQMVYGAIKGLVGSLGDPYTVFLSPEENKQATEDLQGSFEGIGIQIGYKDGVLAVIAPLPATPAEKAGIRAGDFVLMIDDQETMEISLPEAVSLIRGPKDSQVVLTVLHEGDQDTQEITIERGTILVPSVELEFLTSSLGKVAHLKLMRFGDRTNGEWFEAVREIRKQCLVGVEDNLCFGVILDLRNNPGGYLLGAPPVISEFVGSGVALVQEDASGVKTAYNVTGNGQLLSFPLVILTNQGSASASEIVAGALQESDRAKIVGMKTFGKGSIQEAEGLSGGSGIHITTARWLLPSEKSVDKEGLIPDIEVEQNWETEIDEQLEKAKQLLFNNK
ncbi:S41 family peptidase [Patescibacteria group bacterium]